VASRGAHLLTAKSGLGYVLLLSIGCMLALLMYPLRKPSSFSRFSAHQNWFRTHMMLGTLGPLCALYHCNFSPAP